MRVLRPPLDRPRLGLPGGSCSTIFPLVMPSTTRLDAGCFEAIVLDLRELPRLAAGREAKPTAAILD